MIVIDKFRRIAALTKAVDWVRRIETKELQAHELFVAPDMDTAEWQWQRWIKSARLSRLAPVKKTANTVECHLPGIVSATVTNLTNAAAESMNAEFQKVKRMANGYRIQENCCNAIYFHYGGWKWRFRSQIHFMIEAP